MKNKFILAALLVLCCLQSKAAPTWDLRVSDNQRFLQYTDGTPFFWLGDTGWLLPQSLDRSETELPRHLRKKRIQCCAGANHLRSAMHQRLRTILQQQGYAMGHVMLQQPFIDIHLLGPHGLYH